MPHVRSVQSVDLSLLKSNPPQLLISALGTVSSGGWKNGRLEPRYYVAPPEDGIQDYDFVADAPSGVAIQVIMPIAAQAILEDIPSWLNGVRVHSATNQFEAYAEEGKVVAIS